MMRLLLTFRPLALLALGVATLHAEALTVRSPLDWQVVQRESRTLGRIRLEGTAPADTTVEWRALGRPREGQLPADWQTLETMGQPPTFSTEIPLPAGGWYRIEIRARQGATTVASAAVDPVGIGEVFAVAGQSNSANHGEETLKPRSGQVTHFDGKHWQPANDPQPGASGSGGSFLPPLGDELHLQFGVPIGFIATGVGATSVREWLPAGVPFAQPPTLTGNVTQSPDGTWTSRGTLFSQLVTRLQSQGPRGIRAVLWHQGESDANQPDPVHTLPGDDYRRLLTLLIRESQKAAGWEIPWFVAQASYHTPDDPGSPDLRAAQKALWDAGVALAGPDTDSLTGPLREAGGRGVHFSAAGLRAHARLWTARIAPWLESQVNGPFVQAPGRLIPPGMETFSVAGRSAFVFLPPESLRRSPQPWVFYAPTLPAYPDGAERWMHEEFLANGIAVAGVDVGEAYGSPGSHAAFDALYQEMSEKRGFARKPCLFGRSRGGLWVSSWAIARPDRVAGLIGIYPVFDFNTYPGLTNAAPAYGLTPNELASRSDALNPIRNIGVLARAGIPAALIHGDDDTVVPLTPNSGAFQQAYREAGRGNQVTLIILQTQGHNFFEGFFHSQSLVDRAVEWARAGARP
jgi:hypothetical protein